MISFRLSKIPVVVRPSFLAVAALLGFATGDVPRILAWVAIVFFSILIHELGHALTARAFGSMVEIELNAFGGLTSWNMPAKGYSPGRRAAVAGAGSLVGVIFGALVWVVASNTGPYTGMAEFVIDNLVWVNLFWGLLNWLPVRPLDGGHLLMSLLDKVAPRNSARIASIVFLITAAAAVVVAIRFGLLFIGLVGGWLVWIELTRGRARRPPLTIPPMNYEDTPEEESAPDQSSGDH